MPQAGDHSPISRATQVRGPWIFSFILIEKSIEPGNNSEDMKQEMYSDAIEESIFPTKELGRCPFWVSIGKITCTASIMELFCCPNEIVSRKAPDRKIGEPFEMET